MPDLLFSTQDIDCSASKEEQDWWEHYQDFFFAERFPEAAARLQRRAQASVKGKARGKEMPTPRPGHPLLLSPNA